MIIVKMEENVYWVVFQINYGKSYGLIEIQIEDLGKNQLLVLGNPLEEI